MCACAEPGDALVDGCGRVRHRTQDGDAVGEMPLDLRGRDRRRDRQHGLLRREQPADLAEQRVEVLGLDGDHDEGRAADRFGVGERRFDAVALGELVDPLLAAARDDDLLGLAPSGAEQAREQRLADLAAAEDRDAPAVYSHGLSLGGSSRALMRSRRTSGGLSFSGTMPRAAPAIR